MAEKGGPNRAREAIQTLSSILSGLGMPKVPSEVFRQAKFNQSSSYSSMLKLLYRLISVVNLIVTEEELTYSNLPTTEQIMSSVVRELPDEDWMLLIIQRFFYRLGYTRSKFYNSPQLTSQCHSKELLLGLGWIIFEIRLIDKVKECIIHSSSTPILPMKRSVGALLARVQLDCAETELDLEKVTKALQQNNYDKDLLQKLVFINGQLSKQIKILNKSFLAYKRLEEKISSYETTGRMSGVFEAYLLTHPEYYADYVKRLEMHVSLLKLLLHWSKLELSFSKWIESVIELNDKDDTQLSVDCTTMESLSVLKDTIADLRAKINLAISSRKSYFELVDRMKIPPRKYDIQEVISKDTFLLAMESLKHQVDDSERLKTRLCMFEDYVASSEPSLSMDIASLKKEVAKRQTVLQDQLEHLKVIPNTMNVTFTRTPLSSMSS